jgi:putative membrane protein
MPQNKLVITALKGLLMGAADVVPGVSGGTIAFVTGIYEELIKTIDKLDLSILKSLKKHGVTGTMKAYNLGFLIALLAGIAISILSLAKLITHLLATYPIHVWSFFFGLVLASIWYIGSQITKRNATVIAFIALGTAVSYYITIAEPLGSPDSWWYIIFSGFVAIIAMILPGVSGAFLLLLLGSYETVLGSVTGFVEATLAGNLNAALGYFNTLALFAIGCILGLKMFSRVLTWLFTNYKNATLALLTGFMLGSLNKLWPWKEVLETRTNSHGEVVPFLERSILPSQFNGEPFILWSVGLMCIGFLLILILEKWASKKQL